jgi:hypothetical protein
MDRSRAFHRKILKKRTLFLFSFFAVVSSNFCNGQNKYVVGEQSVKQSSPYSLTCCIKAEIAKDKADVHPIKLMKKPYQLGEYTLQIENEKIFIQNIMLQDTESNKWSEQSNVDSISVYAIRDYRYPFFLLSSAIKEATGLSTNLTIWLVIDIKRKFVYQLSSLASDIELFSIHDNSFQVVTLDYSDQFIEDKSYNNMSFDIIHYVLADGEKKIIDKSSSKCPCDCLGCH